MEESWIQALLTTQPLTVPFGGLITVFVIMFFTGRAVSRKVLEERVAEIQKHADERVADITKAADERVAANDKHYEDLLKDKNGQIEQWRSAWQLDEETISALLSHMAELKELSRTGVHLLGALPQPKSEESGT